MTSTFTWEMWRTWSRQSKEYVHSRQLRQLKTDPHWYRQILGALVRRRLVARYLAESFPLRDPELARKKLVSKPAHGVGDYSRLVGSLQNLCINTHKAAISAISVHRFPTSSWRHSPLLCRSPYNSASFTIAVLPLFAFGVRKLAISLLFLSHVFTSNKPLRQM